MYLCLHLHLWLYKYKDGLVHILSCSYTTPSRAMDILMLSTLCAAKISAPAKVSPQSGRKTSAFDWRLCSYANCGRATLYCVANCMHCMNCMQIAGELHFIVLPRVQRCTGCTVNWSLLIFGQNFSNLLNFLHHNIYKEILFKYKEGSFGYRPPPTHPRPPIGIL